MALVKNIGSDYATVNPSQKQSPRKYGAKKRVLNCEKCPYKTWSHHILVEHQLNKHGTQVNYSEESLKLVQEAEERCQQEATKRDGELVPLREKLRRITSMVSLPKIQIEKKIPNICKICGVGCDTNHSLFIHEKTCQQEAAKRDRELVPLREKLRRITSMVPQPKIQMEKKIPNICKICGEGFDTNHSLQKHVISNHEEKHCQKCPYKASSTRFLVEHQLNKHWFPGNSRNEEISKLMQEVEKTCQEEAAKRDRDLVSQLKMHHEVVHDNNEDDRDFVSNLKMHNKVVHDNNEDVVYGMVKKSVGETDKMPKVVVLFKCSWCPTAFYKAEDRTNHVTMMHPEKEEDGVGQEDYTCKECGQAFPTDVMLLKHHLSTHEEKNCEIEDNIIDEGLLHAFPELSNLKGKEKPLEKLELTLQLKKFNQELQPAKCEECDKVLPNDYALQKHKRLFHEEKRCDKCQYRTQSNRHLRAHWMAMHAPKDYKCNQCNFAATFQSNLDKHVKVTHLKVKEHLCDLCGYAATKPEFMKHHIKAVHDKIQDEICPICQRAFALRHNMTTHMKTHMNVEERKKKHNMLKQKSDNVVADELQPKSVIFRMIPDKMSDALDSQDH